MLNVLKGEIKTEEGRNRRMGEAKQKKRRGKNGSTSLQALRKRWAEGSACWRRENKRQRPNINNTGRENHDRRNGEKQGSAAIAEFKEKSKDEHAGKWGIKKWKMAGRSKNKGGERHCVHTRAE